MSELKILKATHGSSKTPLHLGEIKIPCYVLEDGTRVLSGRGIQKSLGTSATTGKWLEKFVNKRDISSHFETGVLDQLNNPIAFIRPDAGGSQSITYGYEATLLIDIIDAIIDASRTGVDVEISVINSAYILSKSLKKVSIIALIDEATGYQNVREKNELQTILKALISSEINIWDDDTFPLSFYKEIFRLWGIPFTEKKIKRKPQFIGHITNRFVYQNLPKGSLVLEVLKNKTPKTLAGNYRYRFHNSLTPKEGRELLKKVIYSVEALASISDTKEKFKWLIEEKYGQRALFSFDELDKLAKENAELMAPNELKKSKKPAFGDLLGAVARAGKPDKD
jgi:hypothetical protein